MSIKTAKAGKSTGHGDEQDESDQNRVCPFCGEKITTTDYSYADHITRNGCSEVGSA